MTILAEQFRPREVGSAAFRLAGGRRQLWCSLASEQSSYRPISATSRPRNGAYNGCSRHLAAHFTSLIGIISRETATGAPSLTRRFSLCFSRLVTPLPPQPGR